MAIRSSKMRALLLIENNSYPQDPRMRAQAETLLRAGYEVTVISPARREQGWHEVVDGVEVFRFRAPPEAGGFLGYLWEYLYSTTALFALSVIACCGRGFDIIHAANPADTLVVIGAFYKFFGKRFIFDHHDLSPELYDANSGGRGNPIVRRALLALEWLSCRVADHVIATNETYKRIEMERCGVPAERITVVRNGPDLTRFNPIEPSPDYRPQGKTVIAYLGAMGLHDGLDCLLRALHHLVNTLQRSDFHCVLIGDGQALEGLKALTTRLELDGFVQFTGWLSGEEKLRALSSADICVDPDPCNPYNDCSTMIKIAEYMALRKPIVAFDLHESRYTAKDAALFACGNDELDFARKLVDLMDDEPSRHFMGMSGRLRAEQCLSWAHSVPNLLAAYNAVTTGGRSRRATLSPEPTIKKR
ncbi:MAG: glycosyl transferase group 1 [Bryobacterales bacterium]|nr:glycosyl transferase group 1 [Bryobacterales bacterium]